MASNEQQPYSCMLVGSPATARKVNLQEVEKSPRVLLMVFIIFLLTSLNKINTVVRTLTV